MRFLFLMFLLGLSTGHAETTGWADRGDIVVLQRLPYERSGRWTLTAFGGVVANDPFAVDLPLGLRLGKLLNESLQLEGSAAFIGPLSVDRDLRRRVGEGPAGDVAVNLKDHALARAQLSANWTLLSGKARGPSGALLYTRGHLLAGFGAVWVEAEEGAPAMRAEALFGVGLETHLTSQSSLRVELRQTVFQRLDGGALTPTELSLGWLYYLGGPLRGSR